MSVTRRHVEMMRIGMTLAAGVLGGMLWAGEAGACEMHRARAEAAPATQAAEPGAEAAREGAKVAPAPPREQHAARCQCGSAADCTCKKGTCECAKCKKPRHEEPVPVEAEARMTPEHTLAA